MGLEYSVDGQIAIFTINNPQSLNALDAITLEQFEEAVNEFNRDMNVRAGIISGSGEKAFCSGIDIKQEINKNLEQKQPLSLMRGLYTNKPLIAAINGAALGGGLELALVCDIRIASLEAVFGFPEVKLGLIPGWGGTQRILHQLSPARASALLYTGNTISAKQALEWGLVNEVCINEEVLANAKKWARVICQAAPLAVQAAKEAMLKGTQLSQDEGLQLEDALYAYLKTTYDFQEGLRAFREKRKPNFTGE